ncbi:Lsr2 family protein [Streptomyces sp. NPDC006475]|uniref:histone-like nucleoid-structuring protein Lsr2 n=1 Tax=Streptomyces sp. NPDC006475 TaxID=3155719 RepID=UPI0033B64F71
MAQKTVTIYTDDLTGEETREAATHTLTIDGIAYEIDLGPDSYDKLLEALAPFTAAGRKVGGRRRGTQGGRRASDGGKDSAAIRAWAKANGYEVSGRGRVPAQVREAYEKAARKAG